MKINLKATFIGQENKANVWLHAKFILVLFQGFAKENLNIPAWSKKIFCQTSINSNKGMKII